MTPDWSAVLDDLDRHLERQERMVLEGRYAEVTAYEPPPGLPPLPADLAPRAAALVRRSRAIEVLAAELRDDTRRRLIRPRSSVTVSRPVAAYVDQRL